MKGLVYLALIALAVGPTVTQIVGDLPQCWEDCINEQNVDCDVLDIPCICRASKGSFLPDTVNCARQKCDGQLDVGLILTPLQLACKLAGQPIPASAVSSAQAAAASSTSTSSSQGPTTVEVTKIITAIPTSSSQESMSDSSQVTSQGSSGGGMSLASTLSTLVTRTTTDQDGNTVYLVQPVVIGPGTLSYGAPSTITTPVTTTMTSEDSTASDSASATAAQTTNGGSSGQHGVVKDVASFGFVSFVLFELLGLY